MIKIGAGAAELPVRLAEMFHDANEAAHVWSSCWCCCPECESDSPWFVTATAELRRQRGRG